MSKVALVWHVHQPFFVPDTEVTEQVRNSYEPLVEVHRQLGLAWSLNVSGALLQRLSQQHPSFVELLRTEQERGAVEFLGSGAHHPMLPLLATWRAAAQVQEDRDVKAQVLSCQPLGFWPTDLAIGHGQTALLAQSGYSFAIADGTSKIAQSMRPSFARDQHFGVPVLAPVMSPLIAESELSQVDRATLGPHSLDFAYRHSTLSWKLVDQTEGALFHADAVEPFADSVLEFLGTADRVLIGEDGERVTTQTLSNYRRCLELLLDRGVTFVSASQYVHAAEPRAAYVPTSTATGDFSAWRTTADDEACLNQLSQVTARLSMLRARATSAPWADHFQQLSAALLPLEDSAFTFWKYARRSREPFLTGLHALSARLDELERTAPFP
jgi:alpha-amylase/alpha-mannosidase (GH57 family)